MQRNPQGERVCVLAPGGSGKSALVIQFVAHHFVVEYDPCSASPDLTSATTHLAGLPVEDSYRKGVMVDGEATMLEILYARPTRSLGLGSPLTRA